MSTGPFPPIITHYGDAFSTMATKKNVAGDMLLEGRMLVTWDEHNCLVGFYSNAAQWNETDGDFSHLKKTTDCSIVTTSPRIEIIPISFGNNQTFILHQINSELKLDHYSMGT